MRHISKCRLYTFLDTGYIALESASDVARKLCDGGSDIIQLRAKNTPLDIIEKTAESVLKITESYNVPLVINDYPKIAIRIGAQFCHLGQEDFFDAGYKTAEQVTGCPREIKLGLSSHSVEQAQRAIKAGADYIAVGPVFPTGTKPTAKPVTLELVKWAAENVKIPWFAIGGITLSNIDEVLSAGARRICVVSAILTAPDITKRCLDFRERLERYKIE